LSADLPQFDFGQFARHPLETNTPTLNGLTSTNPVNIRVNQVSAEARQLVHLYPPTRKLSIQVLAGNQTEMHGGIITHEVKLSMNDQWQIGQEIRHVVFQESFVIPPCKPVWKYTGYK
jgi:hypothetical protein